MPSNRTSIATRRRRRSATAAILAAAVVVLAGCSSSDEPTTPTTDQEPVSAPQGTLSIMSWGSDEDHASIEAIADAYAQEFPDVTIDFSIGDCAIDVGACKTLIAANNMPDVVVSHNNPLTAEAEIGIIQNLDPLIERDGVDLDQFVPASIAGVVSASDGGHYALPMGYHIEVMYFNKALFDEADLDYPDPSGDYTYDDVREWALALTKDGSGNTAEEPDFDPEDVAQYGVYISPNLNGFDPILLANGASMVALDDPTQCTIESPEAVETFQYIQDLMYKDHVAVTPASDQALAGKYQFAEGRVAMLMGAHWMTAIMQQQAPDLSYAVAALPAGSAGNASIVNVHSWAIAQESENTELAWHFLKWATGAGAAPAMGLIPANTSVIGPQFLEGPNEPENLQEAFIAPASWPLTVSPPEFGNSNWVQASGQDGLAPFLDKIFQNSAPAEEALSGACAVLDPILQQ